jgi:preprotein translocase subunit SecA
MLTTMDDLWAELLAAVADLREGVQWLAWGGRQPLYEYRASVHALSQQMETCLAEEIPKRRAEALESHRPPNRLGATWRYMTTDQPFGSWSERLLRGLVRKYKT